MILVIIAAWIVFAYAAAELLPALVALTYHLFAFLFICVFEIVKFTLIGAGWAGRWGARILIWIIVRLAKGVYWASTEAGLFLYILFDEWRHGAGTDKSTDAFADDEPDDDEAQVAYEAARALFGLKPAFSRAALDRAYKQAMKRAHPDAGGNTEDAQVINAARDFLMQAEDWK